MSHDAPAPWVNFGLALNAKGIPYANVSNAARVLQAHPWSKGQIWFDAFHNRIRTKMGLEDKERSWTDADDISVMEWMQSAMQLPSMGLATVQQAVLHVAHKDVRREPETWLRSLQWDGEPRLLYLAVRGFGAEQSDYAIDAGANFMKSLVARMTRPGCKVDTMLVLEGPQGVGKTQVLRILGGPFYAELHSSFGDKDAVQELQGKALLELAELEGLPKREIEIVKAFLSRCVDTYRPSYGRHPIDVPRSCVFVGTTNENSYLRDATGARRFWPLKVGTIDLDWVADNRDQLFAEAHFRVGMGESWWEMPLVETRREQEARFDEDPWTAPIEKFLVGLDTIAPTDLMTEALHLDLAHQDKRAQMRVANVLRRMGWEPRQHGASRRRVWCRPETRPGVSVAEVAQLKASANQSVERGERREIPF